MANLLLRQKSLYIQWINKIAVNEHLQSYVYEWLNPVLREMIWECNLDKTHVMDVTRFECFWTDILKV